MCAEEAVPHSFGRFAGQLAYRRLSIRKIRSKTSLREVSESRAHQSCGCHLLGDSRVGREDAPERIIGCALRPAEGDLYLRLGFAIGEFSD